MPFLYQHCIIYSAAYYTEKFWIWQCIRILGRWGFRNDNSWCQVGFISQTHHFDRIICMSCYLDCALPTEQLIKYSMDKPSVCFCEYNDNIATLYKFKSVRVIDILHYCKSPNLCLMHESNHFQINHYIINEY